MRIQVRFSVIATGLAASLAYAQSDDAIGPGWISAVTDRIADEEYHVTWQQETYLDDVEAAWQAPNRAHDLRTYFTPEGIRVVPRTDRGDSWELGLSLARWGRPGSEMPVVPASEIRPEENTVELDRGPIVEWYVNGREGLEQGFTISERSAGSGPLVLDLALSGGLRPKLSPDGQAVELLKRNGQLAVRYAKLLVEDAAGDRLPAHIEGFAADGRSGLRLVIDDRGARYPILVDPLMTTASWTMDSDQVSAQFGISVATAGDVNGNGYDEVVVGAYGYDNGHDNEGRVFVYNGSSDGLTPTHVWSDEGNQIGAHFGFSAATAGDVNGDGYADLIVGARFYDDGDSDEGKVFVYHGSASGLSLNPDWEIDSNEATAYFGWSVATAGDVNGDGYADVIIGGDGYDNVQLDEGRAWLYHGSSTGLELTHSWSVESNQAGARYGSIVGTAGDVNGDGYADVFVGARNWDEGEVNEGKIWVYHGSSHGVGTGSDWDAQGNQAGAHFGSAAGTAGDVNGDGYADLIVGANQYEDDEQWEGRVYVYHGSATGLSATEDWGQDGNSPTGQFGKSVGTAGDVNGDGYADVIIGAHGYDDGENDEGAAFVYLGSASGLGSSAVWSAQGNQVSARFGNAVATAGDVNGDGFSDVIVGAYIYDNPETDEGQAFVYHGGADGLAATEAWSAEGNQTDAYFGTWVGTAGDVNGDGYSDVIVSAQYYDSGQTDEGKVWVYHGSATGPGAADWSAEGDQDNAGFGSTLSTAGDVNGDGYADVIIGASAYDNEDANEGRAWVYHGSSSGLSLTADWMAEGNQQTAHFGRVGAAGDVNGDGYADVIVGASGHDIDAATFNVGRAYVYHGGASGLSTNADWIVEGTQTGEFVGNHCGTAGDVNGDGYSDVIIGAHGFDGGNQNEGRASVYLGGVGGLDSAPVWSAEGNQDDANLGWRVGTAGDVNGDGYADVIVSAYRHDNGETDEGKVYVYHGHAGGLWGTAAWTAEGNQADARFGTGIGTAGDIDGDRYSDVIVGAPRYDNGEPGEGMAFVYYGSSIGLQTNAAWTAESNLGNADFGTSVGTAGDVNGDGYPDVIVGSRLYDGGLTFEGKAFVFLSGGPARTLKPRQLRVGSNDPIGHLGSSDATDAFRVEMAGFSPFGRGDVALEVEVKPLGAPFDGNGTQTSAFVDSGFTGTTFNEVASSLAEETLYHWRARVLYSRATSPFQQHGPWFTAPRSAWRESALRTGAVSGAGSIDADDPAGQVQVELTAEGNIRLSWGNSCNATDEDYAVYQGEIGDFTSYTPETCSTGGALSYEYPPDPIKSSFYLVVPLDTQSATEGSYGFNGEGEDRAPSTSPCYTQVIEAACP